MFRLRVALSFWFVASFSYAQDFDSRLVNASPEKGKLISRSCQACHVLDQSQEVKFGPNLYDVVGRRIASVSGYDYSPAMAGQNGVWDFGRLNAFLTAPMKVVSGTKMTYPGVASESERADLIAWLRLQSEAPVALPNIQPSQTKSVSATNDIPTEMKLLPKGEGRETVFYLCNACHSVKLVAQQGLSRDSWKETLAWMVDEQGMDPMDNKTTTLVLNYLAKHIGVDSHKD